MLKAFFLISFFVFIFLFLNFNASAQENPDVRLDADATLGVARMIETTEKDLEDGTILSAGINQEGAIRTNIPYDSQILGVVSRNAAIILNATNTENGVPVVSTGTVYVLVTSIGGDIKKGDLITSSIIPGTAQLATNDGYVLGSALEEYSNPNKEEIGTMAVSLDLHYFNSRPTFPGTLSDVFKLVLTPTKEGPSAFFKYLIAAIVTLGSMILGFLSFGRAAAKGVEALGRNPAASKIIHLGIIFNVGIVIAIALAGLGVAFLILRL